MGLELMRLEQDLIVYANDIEANLRLENNTLSQRLQDAELDLDDARRSRRELQHQLNAANQRLSQYGMDNENLKVNGCCDISSRAPANLNRIVIHTLWS